MADGYEKDMIDDEQAYSVMSVYNATQFLQREKFMYAFGDIKFSTPKSLTKITYMALAAMVWSVPMLFLTTFKLDIWYLVLLIAPPVLFGQFASKPIFDGRMFFDWLFVQYGYITRQKVWNDSRPSNRPEVITYGMYNETWVSRRDDAKTLIAFVNNEVDIVDNLYRNNPKEIEKKDKE